MTVYYTSEHEWLRIEGEEAIVGITRHAADALGELVFVEARPNGTSVKAGEAAAVVESVKAASDIYAPVAGEVLAANQDVIDAPESVNADAYGNWLFKLKPNNAADVDALMDAAGYAAEIAQA